MVVLEQSGGKSASKSSESGGLPGSNPYFSSPYLQPLPSDSEMDSKVSPLAMLTRACNKIESDMLSSSTNPQQAAKGKNNNLSPRPRSSENKSAPSPSGNRKCSPPLRSSESTTSKHSAASPSGSGIKPSSPCQEKASPKISAPLASAVSTAQGLSSSSAMTNYTMAAMAAAAAGFPPVLPPNSVSAYASLTAPPGLKGSSNPCNDPLCRDPTCPAVILRQSQYASLMAAAQRNPFMFPPGLGGLSGLPGLGVPPTVAADPTPIVCNWVNGGDFCGKKFASSEDLMVHLRSHTSTSSAATSTSTSAAAKTSKPSPRPSPPADPALAALQAAQAHAALYSPSQPASALAALQAQAARVAAGSVPTPSTTAATPPADIAMAYAAAAARYHPYARPGAAPSSLGSGVLPPHPGLVPGTPGLPPHLSAGLSPYLSSPFGLPLL